MLTLKLIYNIEIFPHFNGLLGLYRVEFPTKLENKALADRY